MKKHIFMVSFLAFGVFLLAGCGHTAPVVQDDPSPDSTPTDTTDDATDTTSQNDTDAPDATDTPGTEPANTNESPTPSEDTSAEVERGESVVRYTIGENASVSYSAQKKWLKKPTEAVIGTNNTVKGTFDYSEVQGMLSGLRAEVDSQAFSSGSGGRDNEVRGILNGPIVIESTKPISGVTKGNFSLTMPLQVTINGVSRVASFAVNGSVSDGSFSAKGSSTINLEDYNIKPFSILGVYEVDKMLGISFDFSAS